MVGPGAGPANAADIFHRESTRDPWIQKVNTSPPPSEPSRVLLTALTVLTVVSGMVAMTAEGGFTGVAAIVSALNSGSVSTGWARYVVISLLAFAMGVRNSTIRRLAVPEVTTTVLTMTLTGLAADSSLAGGHNPRIARRTSAIIAMLVGAFVGAEIFLHQGATWPLAIVAVAVLATATLFAKSEASRRLDG
jgi:uncharacterized membrane protein YoaK (UPF0700 family)